MRANFFPASFLALCATLLATEEFGQTDWSGGDGAAGPVLEWGGGFDSATDVSWLANLGQLALSSEAVALPDGYLLATGKPLAFGVVVADFDQDGDSDIAGASESAGTVFWWRNDGGDPPVWSELAIQSSLPGVNSLAAVDIDGDGRPDLAGTVVDPGQDIVWWKNEGGRPIAWTMHTVDASWTKAFEISVGDVNRDGRPDLMAGSWDGRSLAWWRNDGGVPVVWTRQVVDAAFNGAHSVKTGDLDGDGDNDLVGVAGLADQVAWWRNDGGDPIVWSKQPVIRSGFDGARSVVAADLDRDGDLDVAATCWTSDVAWWRNDGGDPVVWTEQTISDAANGGHSILSADINGDGRLDLVAVAFNARDVIWYENVGGDPFVWTPHMIRGSYPSPIVVAAGDVNGDGAIDVAASSYSGGRFSWWRPTTFLATGELTSSILDTGAGGQPGWLAWKARQPAETGVRFRVRSSDNPLVLGAWSKEIAAPKPLGTLGRYVQYQVRLSTTDPAVSPILEECKLFPGVASRILLDAEPEAVETGSQIRLTTLVGMADSPVRLYVTAVNGMPFVRLLAVAHTDAVGSWNVSIKVPDNAGLAGTNVSFRSVSIAHDGSTVKSNEETVQIQ